MNEDVRRCVAAEGITRDEAVNKGLEQEATEFAEAGAGIYSKAWKICRNRRFK
jgi:hypothetical protein